MSKTEARVDTWMPILVDKYLGDTTHLSTEQHGAYLLLLLACWKRGGKLPADDAQLANIARLPMSRWRQHGPVLLEFFDHVDSHLTQKRLTAELERAHANVEQRRAAGKASAEAKAARKARENGNEKSTAVETGVATEDQREGQRNGKPITHTSPSLRSGEKRGSRLPSDWALPDEWAEWAKTERPELDPTVTACAFADYWHAKTGKDATKADWQATWRNWVRHQRAFPAARPSVVSAEPEWRRIQRERNEAVLGPAAQRRTPATQPELIEEFHANAIRVG